MGPGGALARVLWSRDVREVLTSLRMLGAGEKQSQLVRSTKQPPVPSAQGFGPTGARRPETGKTKELAGGLSVLPAPSCVLSGLAAADLSSLGDRQYEVRPRAEGPSLGKSRGFP